MNHSMTVNYLTGTYYNFLTEYGTKNVPDSGGAFLDKLGDKLADVENVAETENTGGRNTGYMTMEEYKQYIYQKISMIPIHPSQAGWHWNIQISDSGFEAMKNDPEYEAYVLRTIRSNFSYMDQFHTQTYSVLHFGATKEETRGESFSYGSAVSRKSQEETFWERRAERKKRQKEWYDNWLEKRALAKRIRQRLFLEGNSQAAAICEANILAGVVKSSVILNKKG